MRIFSTTTKRLGQKGFTLVELLIVVIILAILAAIIVPQFGSSTEDANVSTLKSNLSSMRNLIELYYQQHGARYPGAYLESDGTTASAAGTCPAAFLAQLTMYTDQNGKTSGTKTNVFKYGPYLKGTTLPTNPFLDNALICDVATVDLTTAVTASGTTGWKMYTGTGRLVANDGKTLKDGTTTTLSF